MWEESGGLGTGECHESPQWVYTMLKHMRFSLSLLVLDKRSMQHLVSFA